MAVVEGVVSDQHTSGLLIDMLSVGRCGNGPRRLSVILVLIGIHCPRKSKARPVVSNASAKSGAGRGAVCPRYA